MVSLRTEVKFSSVMFTQTQNCAKKQKRMKYFGVNVLWNDYVIDTQAHVRLMFDFVVTIKTSNKCVQNNAEITTYSHEFY